jgi:hypothetical protein
MKALKPRATARPSAEDALRIAAQQAPALPPARMETQDGPTTLNLRLRLSTVTALAAKAKAEGLTQKQVVCLALATAGVAVAPEDLEDRTPRRKP